MKEILVVEDNESYQFLTEMIVMEVDEAITIHKAYDGIEALEMINEQGIEPDIILLDINMPRMNGHEFLTEFAKIRNGDIPVVAMLTSSDQTEDKQRASNYDFVRDYIVKPLQPEHLHKLRDIVLDFIKS